MTTISLKQISKDFGATSALTDISLVIPASSFFFLLGASGSGKTTLLRLIGGLEKPTKGSVEFDGKLMNDVPIDNREVGIVFQSYALWPHLTVKEHILFGLKAKKFSSSEQARRVEKVTTLSQLAPFLNRYPHQLSGGQQQRVAVARALALEPKILLLDEPLANLDPTLRWNVLRHIIALKEQLNLTVVYVTHNREECLAAGQQAAFIHQGKVLQLGAPQELYSSPISLEIAQFFGDINQLTSDDLHFLSLKPNARYLIRPHLIGIRKEASENTIPATLLHAEFQGSYTRTTVKTELGKELIIHDAYHVALETPTSTSFFLNFEPQQLIELQ